MTADRYRVLEWAFAIWGTVVTVLLVAGVAVGVFYRQQWWYLLALLPGAYTGWLAVLEWRTLWRERRR